MLKPKVDLLKEVSLDQTPSSNEASPQPRRRHRVFIAAVVFFLLLGGLAVANVIIPSIRLSASLGSSNLFIQLKHLTFGGDREVRGEEDNRVNVLLIGVGGEGHDGPLLTDTIMIASLQPSTGKASLTSLPRDLLVPYPNGSWRKINEAYSVGEQENPGNGAEFAARVIGDTMGLYLPYYVVVDFEGFENIVNHLGGVNVYVERTFTDPLYPTPDDKTKSVSFSAGWQHLDGEEALVFARSRHGNNGEGSDFARARRQQKIILATKDRLLSKSVLFNPLAVNRLAGEFANNITTNLEPWEIWRLYTLSKNVNPENVVRLTPDNSPGGLLMDGVTAEGAYILQPRGGSFETLQSTVRNIFSNDAFIQEPPRVEVQNGTSVSGLAARTSEALEQRGYRIVATTNAADRNVKETIIYDYTGGGKPASLAALRLLFNARVATSIPAWLVPSAVTLDPHADSFQSPSSPLNKADFLIIIGSDAADELSHIDVLTEPS